MPNFLVDLWLEFNSIRVITKGNLLFRDKIKINPEKKLVQFWKRNWYGIGHNEITLNFNQITSIEIITRKEWFLFCDLRIESMGGSILKANGFSIKDATSIKNLIGYLS